MHSLALGASITRFPCVVHCDLRLGFMRILLSETQIATRLDELGHELSTAYRGRPLTVVGVLTGSLLFVADLMRKLDVPHQVGFLQASSYRSGTQAGTLTVNREFFPRSPIAMSS